MNVVDSSGWIEFFGDGPNASAFLVPIRDRARLVVPSLSIVEVFRVMRPRLGRSRALEIVSQMERGLVVSLDRVLAIEAADISLETGLPLADSIILATARAYEATLWTQDADFDGMDGVRYLAPRSPRRG